MINIIRDLPILCNVKWEEHGRNEEGINGVEVVQRRKEGWDFVSNSLSSGIPHISLDDPWLQHTEQTAGVKVDRLLKIGKSHRIRKKYHFLVNALESYSIMVSNTQD